MSNISFSIGGIIYIILLLIICIIRKVGKSKIENKVYLSLIIVALFGITLDCISFFLTISGMNINNPIYITLTKLILCYYDTWCFLFLLYIIAVLLRKKDKTKEYQKYQTILLIYCLPILIIINIIFPVNYIVQENSIFPQGLGVTLCYSLAVISILIMVILLLKNKNHIKDREFIPLWLLLILTAVTIAIQCIIPGLILTTAIEAFETFIMYFTIENPDMKMIEQLNSAKDQADKANAAKTDFLSSMSHEIRTPLNAITGFSDCIKEAKTLKEAKENANDIINASNTLLEIVNGILDISKIEAGKLEIINSPYNAQELFADLGKLITPRMKEKGLDFSYHIAEDLPPTLYGDHANIKKIITNLLSNACKYTDKGYVHYEVSCVKNDKTCKLLITVEDSGRGIKKENIDKLFTKFQRLEEDRNTTIEGTGLGLAITKQLIELMGGRIIVHTVYGQGSKFTVMIDQKIEKTIGTENDKKKKTTLDLTEEKILIVDDNPLNLKVAKKILERYHAQNIDTVESGLECLEKIKEGKNYDLILLDDMMPKMSGVETLKELKKLPNFHIPVIALTANAINGMKEKYLKDGFNNYLSKPINQDELIQVMNEVLEKEPTIEIKIQKEVSEEKTQEEKEINPKEFLKQKGIEIEKALELLGDMEMYEETVEAFIEEIEEKWNKLIEYKEKGNMKDYAIEVHSLKSDAKYLGLTKLAEIAYDHEIKSKAEDNNYIEDHFQELAEEKEKSLEIIQEYQNLAKKKK